MQVFRGWIAIAFCLATPSLTSLGANPGGIAVPGGPLQPTPFAAQKENGRTTADAFREAGLIFASSPSSTPPSPWGGELVGQLLMALGDDDVPEAVRLLESGAAVNGDLTGDGMTPLMLAQSPEMVTALLGRGADPNQRDGTGQTALHHLVFAQRAEQMLPLLVNVGAEENAVARGYNGQTPLLAARQLFFEGGDPDHAERILRLLQRMGAAVDAQDASGYTVVITAAVNDKRRMAQLMLFLGADPHVRTRDGMTALAWEKELGLQRLPR